MPSMFALADKVIGDPVIATFAAFGSFAMLLLVGFGGPMRDRLRAQAGLVLAGAVLICLGTLASRSAVLAAATMALVAFAVLFAGVVSSVLAGASVSLLLAFILSVSLAGPISSIPARLAGWGLAGAASLIAIAVLWPEPEHDQLRGPMIAACRALAARLRSEVACALDGQGGSSTEAHDVAVAQASAAVERLRRAFFATPYRPTGLGTAPRLLVRLVDELSWLSAIMAATTRSGGRLVAGPWCAVKSAAALVLEQGAELLETHGASLEPLHGAQRQLQAALAELEQGASLPLPARPTAERDRIGEFISSLDPSFRAQELAFVAAQVASNIDLAILAERRSLKERLLGRLPPGLSGPLSAAQERAGSHVGRRSVWLHNSVRGAVGLAAAVLVAKQTDVQHSFWVVLGTLSMLRSNALSTGQNAWRGLLGTTAGFIVGGALVVLIGTGTTLLWLLLPVAILLAGVAPAVISFAAGQAAFTLTIIILFNIIAPAGWKLGLVRVEDVALGAAVSLVAGLLFWPRGAAAALGNALADAYATAAQYLARAVEFGAARCDRGAPSTPEPKSEAGAAAAAFRRLDDTFRGFMIERGPKPLALAQVTRLMTGAAALRLHADAILDLWERDGRDDGDREAARSELLASAELTRAWYSDFATSLTGSHEAPEPLAQDGLANDRLVDAVSRDLLSEDGRASSAAARLIWTGDHLDAVRRLQYGLVGPAMQAPLQHPATPASLIAEGLDSLGRRSAVTSGASVTGRGPAE